MMGQKQKVRVREKKNSNENVHDGYERKIE